ncbi:hypothetical protein AKJ40_04875 [candidate division MSBL1 archaeon SCGC-AAA259M10]|uniref:TATA-box-binding protein n=2 Tax=candidate division MSBL1 TaxID=215777 RepID=A0A133U5R0_9EURY|nr:hypothetical protein AKJ62_03025 [candidate division MSBL1 archaeon SCGC-AAA259D14]KXA98256.1 hypothetical protein AKJ40_04875 [candidate division MSBL1 archaeon SCGC-AAA259M10]
MSDAEYKVNNVVLTVSYRDTELDLEKVASNLEGARYAPEVFAGVIYRMPEPKASFLIFASGKANCVGARSIESAEAAIGNLTEQLREQSFDVGEPEIEIQNMVASVEFHRRFDLEQIARNIPNVEYNPEVFPGLVFRMEGSSVAVLLFVQGKGVAVGAKSEEEIRKALDRIAETIE